MKVVYKQENPIEFQFTVDPDSEPHKAALDAIRHLTDLNRLIEFAKKRHGYSTDGYFSVSYPSDLDEYDRTQGSSIPEGHIEVEAGYGEPNTKCYKLPEADYLDILRQYLRIRGRGDLAEKI